MKRTLLFLSLILFLGTKSNIQADVLDSIANDSVLISEASIWSGGNWTRWGYCELYNASSKTVDLSNFFLLSRYQNGNFQAINEPFHRLKYTFEGTLEPGETHVLFFIPENLSKNPDDILLYPNGYYNYDVLTKAQEICKHSNDLDSHGGYLLNHYAIALFNRIPGKDSVLIDLVNEDNTTADYPDDNAKAIAGVAAPINEYILVRKTHIKTGNPNWDESRADDAQNSEWILIPKTQLIDEYAVSFTTIGYHGNSAFELSSSKLTIDLNNQTISMPYGIRRDSLIRYLELGDNLAYFLKWGNDTSNVFCQNDDTLKIYHPGAEATILKFALKVDPKPATFNEVAPLRYIDTNGNWNERYLVTQLTGVMDTIYDIPFGTRIDTLLKYLVIPENSTTSITFVGETERPDLISGDILNINIEGQDPESYFLKLDPYFNNHDAELSAIVLPGLGLWENPSTFYPTDTLLNFNPTSTIYYITLPVETETAPYVLPVPADSRSNISITKPSNLFGNEQNRTCTIKVTAEDDTSIAEYKIVFNVESERPTLVGEPFFTDIANAVGWPSAMNLQIFNPNDEEIDLGDYVLLVAPFQASLTEIINNVNRWEQGNPSLDFKKRNEYMLRPGYKFVSSAEDSSLSISTNDPIQRSSVLPSREVYSIADITAFPRKGGNDEQLSKVDIFVVPQWRGSIRNIENEDYAYNIYGTGYTLFNRFDNWSTTGQNGSVGLVKILNDSVKEGSKVFNDINDFEMVDIINGFEYNGTWFLNDTLQVMKDGNYDKMYRKPWVSTGNPFSKASFGTATTESEWVPYNEKDIFKGRFENHTFNPTSHISYLLSNTYLISRGLSEKESIDGVLNGTKVTDFLDNIIKPNENMMLQIVSASGETRSDNDVLITGDKVITTSTDGNNSVTYIIKAGTGLSDDNTISSTSYSIDLTAKTVSNIPFGTTIIEILGNITKAAGSKLTVVDDQNQVVGTVRYDNDTIKHEKEQLIDIIAGNNIYLEVVAQNGVNKALYHLILNKQASDAYVLSNVYVVDQDKKVINFVNGLTVNFFLKNLIPAPGSTIKVVNKLNQDKTQGWLAFDDKLVVTSEDGTTMRTYYLKFFKEEMADAIVSNSINELKVYPNPSNGLVRIEGTSSFETLSVYSITGQIVEQHHIFNDFTTVDLTKSQNGLYIVKLESNNGLSIAVKLIKK